MKTKALFLLSAFPMAVLAAPVIPEGSVAVSDEARTRTMLVSYTLSGESAVVTCEVFTNGVQVVGPTLVGDVGVKVGVGAREIRWPYAATLERGVEAADVTVKVTAWPLGTPPPYLVADMTRVGWTFCSSTNSLPGGLGDIRYRTNRLVLRRIPAKDVVWRMGWNWKQSGDHLKSDAPHYVKLTADYYMAVFEMTQGQWKAMGWGFPSTQTVTDDANPVQFAAWSNLRGGTSYWPEVTTVTSGSYLGQIQERTGLALDLPTDAQWEYACRAGSSTASNIEGINTDSDKILGWYNNVKVPQKVGLKRCNAWGLYDMHGNLWEWCLDVYAMNWTSETDNWYANAYNQKTVSDGGATVYVDPVGAASNNAKGSRVLRGGSYANGTENAYSFFRYSTGQDNGYAAYSGIRLTCPIPSL